METALYYEICFFISVLLTIAYIYLWHEGMDVNMTCLFVLLPIVNLGCVWMYWAPTFEFAIIANIIVYLAGCFWPVFAINAILELCNLKLKKRYKMVEFILAFIFFGFALTTDRPGPLYRSVEGVMIDGRVQLFPEYGWMHTVIYIVMAFYAITGVVILVYAIKNKVRASIKNMYVMFIAELITMIVFFIYGMRKLSGSPAILYVVTQFALLIVGYRSYFYDIDASVMDTIVTEGKLGYITFDKRKCLLGCNGVAENMFPELKTVRADKPLDNMDGIKSTIADIIASIEQSRNPVNVIVPLGTRKISITGDLYYLRGRKPSYRIIMEDDTDHQDLISLLNKEKNEAKEETRHVTDTLQRYVDPNIANKVLETASYNSGNGEERNIAVLFADIRGFTSLSESKSPRDVMTILNTVLEVMTSCIMNHHGTVDKIIGDCVMATWNTMSDDKDFVYQACKTALEMQVAIQELNGRLRKNFDVDLHIGIGINSGLAIVGDIGTEKRSDYTTIGDTVNIASRLEGIAAPDEILVTENITRILNGRGVFLPYTEKGVTLKGKSREVTVMKLDHLI